jgi:hypothetical protein
MEHGWPKSKVKADRIWQFDLNNNHTTEYLRDYDPSTDQWDWGLIEVAHE